MQADLTTFRKFVDALDEELATTAQDSPPSMFEVRHMGEVIGCMAMMCIARSGIDEFDAPALMQEFGLGLINGTFYAGKFEPLPWYDTLTKEQADYLQETTGVMAHETN